MQILFATGNENKASEASSILTPLGYEVKILNINGINPELIEPQADDIEEVAISKIEQALDFVKGSELEGIPILVEDSGLFIESLGGFPGPYSSYVERKIGLSGILKLMVQESDRRAEYRAVSIISDGRSNFVGKGVSTGVISIEEIGNMGFGYDPIFIPNGGDGRTCGEMTYEEKSLISHRAKALKLVSEYLDPPSK